MEGAEGLQETSASPGDGFGFKVFNEENLTASDLPPMTGLNDPKMWVQWFQEPQLAPTVPVQVRRMFEIARGTMISGWVFHPLMSIGLDQCMYCLEAAAREAAFASGAVGEASKKKLPLHGIVKRLRDRGLIRDTEVPLWEAARALRNEAAHPETPTIVWPSQAKGILVRVGDDINQLFERVEGMPSGT